MASIQPISCQAPVIPYRPPTLSHFPTIVSPKILLRTPRNFTYSLCSSPKAIPITEEEVLQAIADSDERNLPCVRTYENDLSRLTLVGAVDFQQSLTAAAADGGEAAKEHIDSGMPTMVVETVYPGPEDGHATVSTRLFLPARKVKEKARKLRSSLNDDILSSSSSKNILAMTFRQVVLQQLWSFELVVYKPGSERDMEDLENPREVPISFTLSSSDEGVLSVLAEAVCICALQSTEKDFLDSLLDKASNSFFHWFQKPKRIASKDSSIIIYKLFQEEIVENAKGLLEKFSYVKNNFKLVTSKLKNAWWTPSEHSKLEKIGGREFSAWASEYVPAYRLQIDANRLESLKFEGWRKLTENRWEVLLTHSQMVGLANILDMFYEDLYSLPEKQLSCGIIAGSAYLSIKKRNTSLFRFLSVTLAGGIFLVTISAFGQFGLPQLRNSRKYPAEKSSIPPLSEVDFTQQSSLDAAKLEECCILVVNKIKDAFEWPGDTLAEEGIGAWTGEIPNYLRIVNTTDGENEDAPLSSIPSEIIDEEMKASVQEIASYQVVLSTDGEVVGFQPTSRVAVNQWAANPLAKELYSGRKLSPGIMEPGLKISRPNQLVLIELLMSVKQGECFALARPVR